MRIFMLHVCMFWNTLCVRDNEMGPDNGPTWHFGTQSSTVCSAQQLTSAFNALAVSLIANRLFSTFLVTIPTKDEGVYPPSSISFMAMARFFFLLRSVRRVSNRKSCEIPVSLGRHTTFTSPCIRVKCFSLL